MTPAELYYFLQRLRKRKFAITDEEVVVTPPQDIFEKHTWTYAFDSKDISGASWPSSPLGTQSLTLTAAGSNAVVNRSTSPLLSAGIGASRVNKSARAAAGVSQQYGNAAHTSVTSGTKFWIRFVYKRVSTDTNYLWRLFANATTGLYRFKNLSAANLETTLTNAFVPTSASTTPPGQSGWYLVDIVHRKTGGPAGVTRANIYVNGVDRTADDTVANTLVNATNISLFGINLDPVSQQDLLFFGFVTEGEISLAAHQADALQAGFM